MKNFSLIPAHTKINFLGQKWSAFILSSALIAGTVFLLFTKGLNFGIDFTGGIVIELKAEQDIELALLRAPLNNSPLGTINLQHISEAGDKGAKNQIMIRLGKQPENNFQTLVTHGCIPSTLGNNKQEPNANTAAIACLKSILNTEIGGTVDYRKVDYVGPQVGEELIVSGAKALIFAFIAIMLYIWVRFEWQFGLGAIIALIHDTLLTVGLFSLLQLEFNLTSVAAILTIIGYSINDSVVIFDRIRENLRKYKKTPLPEILNISINDTLSRTILTAGTTIVALIALVWLGGHVIEGFSIAVLFGVIVGTYSSIFIAAPILDFMNLRNAFSTGKAEAEAVQ